MNLSIIKTKVESILTNAKLTLYSLKKKYEFGTNIIEILIDNQLSHDELEPLTNTILDAIDADIPEGFLLEVSTVGPEKELKTLADVSLAIGTYIYLKSDSYTGYATLLTVNDNILEIEYLQKGKFTKKSIKYPTVSFIRKAIKF